MLIRKTCSVCPYCINKIPAYIMEESGEVYLKKECPEHGKFSLLVSKNASFYKKLNNLYFSLFSTPLEQKDYIVHVTNQCNLNCPICLANSNTEGGKGEYEIEELKDFLHQNKDYKIDLMGAEPTMREDLFKIINLVRKSNNIPTLHTNGIKLANFQYLKSLHNAGLREVHFQFDSFNDEVYEKIRGRKLLGCKLKALENIERLSISTDIKMTVVKGLNDNELTKMLNFCVGKDFIKELFFLGCRYLGRAREKNIENCLMPDELLYMFLDQCNKNLNYEDFILFHKIYYRILALFSVRKCFYNRHLLLVKNRDDSDYFPITNLLQLTKIFENIGNGKLINLLKELSRVVVKGENMFSLFSSFDLSNFPDSFLLLGFISACDKYSFDSDIARNCGKGAISSRRGVQPCGALDNINRDCQFQNFEKNEYSSSS